MKERMPRIINNWFSHLICKIWFNVNAIALTPIGVVILSKRYEKYPEWIRNITLKHELKHMQQSEKIGRIRFMMKYIFDKRCRLQWEAEAYCINIREYMIQYNWLTANELISKYARVLSSRVYLWMVSYEDAKALLTKLYLAS